MAISIEALSEAAKGEDKLLVLSEYYNVLEQVVDRCKVETSGLPVEQLRLVISKQKELRDLCEKIYASIELADKDFENVISKDIFDLMERVDSFEKEMSNIS